MDFPIKLLLSLLLGAAIGLERESGEGERENSLLSAGGVRTYALVCLIGAISGVFIVKNFYEPFLLITSAFVLMLVGYYILGSFITKSLGMTTEVSLLFTYFLGFMISAEVLPMRILVALVMVVMLILAFKNKTKELVAGISHGEVKAFISYAIISMVILPFLPNTSYTLSDAPFLKHALEQAGANLGAYANLEIFNPKNIWFVVVLITGIDIFSHVLSKILGKGKGLAVTSFAAGFVSSTSATVSLAQKSLKAERTEYFVGAALLANLASFLQIFLLIAPLNIQFLFKATPIILTMIAVSGGLSWYFMSKKHGKEIVDLSHDKDRKIFSLLPAIKFALLLLVVKIITKISLVAFGESGFLASSVLASLAGLDAILINLSEMAGKTVAIPFALLTLILINTTNLMSKTAYSLFAGNKKFALQFGLSAILISLFPLVGLLWIF